MNVNNVIVEKDTIDQMTAEDVIIESMIATEDVIFVDDVMSGGNILIDDNLKVNKTITTKERKQRIARLKAEIKKEEALLKQNLKKERTDQLIVFGILVEEIFKTCSDADRHRWIETTKGYLDGEYCHRALEGFERLKKLKLK